MGRESRKAQRKARRSLERSTPPTPISALEGRDPSTRWRNLTARGGQRLSFVSVGPKVSVDLDDPSAPFALALSLAGAADA